ncbi:hypothetical protein BB560_002756 [Smittium megazygosporum]|uniref:1-phosphatidylinositol-3-phosphate 5-kinase n=1 Tax=Smittium megazygosporum TaxID=133381 RepID=A0A2T9ZDX0_9FUNG|nr:hypothetical protein BB560_002756 [Smittium megazygosporum]
MQFVSFKDFKVASTETERPPPKLTTWVEKFKASINNSFQRISPGGTSKQSSKLNNSRPQGRAGSASDKAVLDHLNNIISTSASNLNPFVIKDLTPTLSPQKSNSYLADSPNPNGLPILKRTRASSRASVFQPESRKHVHLGSSPSIDSFRRSSSLRRSAFISDLSPKTNQDSFYSNLSASDNYSPRAKNPSRNNNSISISINSLEKEVIPLFSSNNQFPKNKSVIEDSELKDNPNESGTANTFPSSFSGLFSLLNEKQEHWISDSAVKSCMGCEKPFSTFWRKHHCRVCGKVFCSLCIENCFSNNKSRSNETYKACKTCFSNFVNSVSKDSFFDHNSNYKLSDIFNPSRSEFIPYNVNPKSSTTKSMSFLDSKRPSNASDNKKLPQPQHNFHIIADDMAKARPKTPVYNNANPKANFPLKNPHQYSFITHDKFAGNTSYLNSFNYYKSSFLDPVVSRDSNENFFFSKNALKLAASENYNFCIDSSDLSLNLEFKDKPFVEDQGEFDLFSIDDLKEDIRQNDLSITLPHSNPEILAPLISRKGTANSSDNPKNIDFSKERQVHFSMMFTQSTFLHLRSMCAKLLELEGISKSSEWVDVITPLVIKAVDLVRPAVDLGGSNDLGQYVRVKTIPFGSPQDSKYFSGVIFKNRFSHKKMQQKLSNLRILIIKFPISFVDSSSHFVSLDKPKDHEEEFVNRLVVRILSLKPNLLLLENGISQAALDIFFEKKVSVITGMKYKTLQAVAYFTGADIVSTLDMLAAGPNVGVCKSMTSSLTYQTEIIDFSLQDIYLDGCIPERGGTIVIRGECKEFLASVKKVTKMMVSLAYSLALQSSLLSDQFGAISYTHSCNSELNLPPDISDHRIKMILDRYKSSVITTFPEIKLSLPIDVYIMVEAINKLHLLNRNYSHLNLNFDGDNHNLNPSLFSQRYFDESSPYSVFKVQKITDDYRAFQAYKSEATFLERKINRGRQFLMEFSYPPTLWENQTLVLIHYVKINKDFCSRINSICVEPGVHFIEFHFSSDITLGQYLYEMCFDLDMDCPSVNPCPEPLYQHTRCYVHKNASVEVTMKEYPCPIVGMSEIMLMWEECRKCGVKTPYSALSYSTWHVSFGKYLEFFFNGQYLVPRVKLCSHSLYHDYTHWFAYRNMAVNVNYSKIKLYDIYPPSSPLKISLEVNISLKMQEAEELGVKINEYFDSLITSLESLLIGSLPKYLHKSLNAIIKNLVGRAISERKYFQQMLTQTLENTNPSNTLSLIVIYEKLQQKVSEWDLQLSEFYSDFIKLKTRTGDMDTFKEKFFLAPTQIRKAFFSNFYNKKPSIFDESLPDPLKAKPKGKETNNRGIQLIDDESISSKKNKPAIYGSSVDLDNLNNSTNIKDIIASLGTSPGSKTSLETSVQYKKYNFSRKHSRLRKLQLNSMREERYVYSRLRDLMCTNCETNNYQYYSDLLYKLNFLSDTLLIEKIEDSLKKPKNNSSLGLLLSQNKPKESTVDSDLLNMNPVIPELSGVNPVLSNQNLKSNSKAVSRDLYKNEKGYSKPKRNLREKEYYLSNIKKNISETRNQTSNSTPLLDRKMNYIYSKPTSILGVDSRRTLKNSSSIQTFDTKTTTATCKGSSEKGRLKKNTYPLSSKTTASLYKGEKSSRKDYMPTAAHELTQKKVNTHTNNIGINSLKTNVSKTHLPNNGRFTRNCKEPVKSDSAKSKILSNLSENGFEAFRRYTLNQNSRIDAFPPIFENISHNSRLLAPSTVKTINLQSRELSLSSIREFSAKNQNLKFQPRDHILAKNESKQNTQVKGVHTQYKSNDVYKKINSKQSFSGKHSTGIDHKKKVKGSRFYLTPELSGRDKRRSLLIHPERYLEPESEIISGKKIINGYGSKVYESDISKQKKLDSGNLTPGIGFSNFNCSFSRDSDCNSFSTATSEFRSLSESKELTRRSLFEANKSLLPLNSSRSQSNDASPGKNKNGFDFSASRKDIFDGLKYSTVSTSRNVNPKDDVIGSPVSNISRLSQISDISLAHKYNEGESVDLDTSPQESSSELSESDIESNIVDLANDDRTQGSLTTQSKALRMNNCNSLSSSRHGIKGLNNRNNRSDLESKGFVQTLQSKFKPIQSTWASLKTSLFGLPKKENINNVNLIENNPLKDGDKRNRKYSKLQRKKFLDRSSDIKNQRRLSIPISKSVDSRFISSLDVKNQHKMTHSPSYTLTKKTSNTENDTNSEGASMSPISGNDEYLNPKNKICSSVESFILGSSNFPFKFEHDTKETAEREQKLINSSNRPSFEYPLRKTGTQKSSFSIDGNSLVQEKRDFSSFFELRGQRNSKADLTSVYPGFNPDFDSFEDPLTDNYLLQYNHLNDLLFNNSEDGDLIHNSDNFTEIGSKHRGFELLSKLCTPLESPPQSYSDKFLELPYLNSVELGGESSSVKKTSTGSVSNTTQRSDNYLYENVSLFPRLDKKPYSSSNRHIIRSLFPSKSNQTSETASFTFGPNNEPYSEDPYTEESINGLNRNLYKIELSSTDQMKRPISTRLLLNHGNTDPRDNYSNEKTPRILYTASNADINKHAETNNTLYTGKVPLHDLGNNQNEDPSANANASSKINSNDNSKQHENVGQFWKSFLGLLQIQENSGVFNVKLNLKYPLLLTDHVIKNCPIIIRETEPSSIIAFILSSPNYQAELNKFEEKYKLEFLELYEYGDVFKGNEKQNEEIVDSQQSVDFDSQSAKYEEDEKVLSESGDFKYLKNTNKHEIALLHLPGQHVEIGFVSGETLFNCKLYYIAQFDALRKIHLCDMTIVESLSRCTEYLATGGKSGSQFLKTKDERYIIKQAFDLKGSIRNRLVDEENHPQVLQDENFINMIQDTPVFVKVAAKRYLHDAIWNDTLFLSKMNVMDYSLLVGIDNENEELVVGIVDYIRTYTWDKKLESWVKESVFRSQGGKEPTIISPRQYKTRFRDAMEGYFWISTDNYD